MLVLVEHRPNFVTIGPSSCVSPRLPYRTISIASNFSSAQVLTMVGVVGKSAG